MEAATELKDNGAQRRWIWPTKQLAPIAKKIEFGGEQCVCSALTVMGVLIFNSYVKFEKFGLRSKYVDS